MIDANQAAILAQQLATPAALARTPVPSVLHTLCAKLSKLFLCSLVLPILLMQVPPIAREVAHSTPPAGREGEGVGKVSARQLGLPG